MKNEEPLFIYDQLVKKDRSISHVLKEILCEQLVPLKHYIVLST